MMAHINLKYEVLLLVCNWTVVGTQEVVFLPFTNSSETQRRNPHIRGKTVKTASTQPVTATSTHSWVNSPKAAAAASFHHSQAPLGTEPVVCYTEKATLQPPHLPETQDPSKTSGTFLTLFGTLPPISLDAQAQDYAKPDGEGLLKRCFIIRKMTS